MVAEWDSRYGRRPDREDRTGLGFLDARATRTCANGETVPLDFTAGKVARAPEIMRRMRLEWLFRLLLEPKRLFGRYVIGIPVFFWRAKRYVASAAGRRGA